MAERLVVQIANDYIEAAEKFVAEIGPKAQVMLEFMTNLEIENRLNDTPEKFVAMLQRLSSCGITIGLGFPEIAAALSVVFEATKSMPGVFHDFGRLS